MKYLEESLQEDYFLTIFVGSLHCVQVSWVTEIVDWFPNDIIRGPITKLGDPNINKQREVKLFFFPFKGINN